MKHVLVSVISDLATDQRVHRTSITLKEIGYQVVTVGRTLKSSPALEKRSYQTRRFTLWWEKGPLFYAAFNIRLFFFLLFNKADLLVANDLDTLLPNYLISKLKRIPLIYDSHEYFTEVPELQHRPAIKKVWQKIEASVFPRLKHIVTVNDSIASLYKARYGKEVLVIRNVPETQASVEPIHPRDLGIPAGNSIAIFQGSGINIHRGAEEALDSMQYLEQVTLLFVGGGDVVEALKLATEQKGLKQKVIFVPRQSPQELRRYTAMATIGLSLDKDTNINYRFSLPNKLFDYIHAGIPVLASALPEVQKIVNDYEVGIVAENHSPQHLADCIRYMISDPERLLKWKENLKLAALELCWENEKKKMIALIHAV